MDWNRMRNLHKYLNYMASLPSHFFKMFFLYHWYHNILLNIFVASSLILLCSTHLSIQSSWILNALERVHSVFGCLRYTIFLGVDTLPSTLSAYCQQCGLSCLNFCPCNCLLYFLTIPCFCFYSSMYFLCSFMPFFLLLKTLCNVTCLVWSEHYW